MINNLKLPMIFAYLGSEGLARRRLELETSQEKAAWQVGESESHVGQKANCCTLIMQNA